MSQSTQSDTSYLVAHSNEEVRRLERQAQFVNNLTSGSLAKFSGIHSMLHKPHRRYEMKCYAIGNGK